MLSLIHSDTWLTEIESAVCLLGVSLWFFDPQANLLGTRLPKLPFFPLSYDWVPGCPFALFGLFQLAAVLRVEYPLRAAAALASVFSWMLLTHIYWTSGLFFVGKMVWPVFVLAQIFCYLSNASKRSVIFWDSMHSIQLRSQKPSYQPQQE